MKNIYIIYLLFSGALLLSVISCKEGDGEPVIEQDNGLPKIAFINPMEGKPGDVVSIYGKNFSTIKEENLLKISGISMEVTSADSGKITAIIPSKSKSGKIALTIKNTTVETEDFNIVYASPIVSGIEPATAKPGEIITIKGEDFGEASASNRVTFDNIEGKVISFTKNELKVEVPSVAYKTVVKVSSNSKPANMVYYPVIPVPIISRITPTIACPGMQLSIYGSRLDEGFNLKIGFNNSTLPFSSMSSGPSGPYVLYVAVPESAVSDQVTVTATTGTAIGPQIQIVSKPTIVPPAIKTGAIGSEVTIEGTNLLSFGQEGVEVQFNYNTAEIVSITNTSVKVKIPAGVSGSNELKVSIYGYRMSAGTFTVQ